MLLKIFESVAILYYVLNLGGAFLAISPYTCPENPDALPECTWGMNEEDLCEADRILPNGNANFNVNNCGKDDVFKFIQGTGCYSKLCV